MLVLDHLKLVKRDWREVEKLKKHLIKAESGTLTEMSVLHEADHKCCKKEPWEKTFRILHDAIAPPTPTIPVNLSPPPSADDKA